jgi:hypothetical protein
MVITKHFFKPLEKYLAIFIHLFHCANMTIPLKKNTSREVTNNYTLHDDEYQKILSCNFYIMQNLDGIFKHNHKAQNLMSRH